jgi:hypothetical protein
MQKRGACLLVLLRSLFTIRPLPSAFCRLPSIIARSAALKVEAPVEIHKKRIRYRRNEAISFRILYFWSFARTCGNARAGEFVLYFVFVFYPLSTLCHTSSYPQLATRNTSTQHRASSIKPAIGGLPLRSSIECRGIAPMAGGVNFPQIRMI